jgi:hypothetical protein
VRASLQRRRRRRRRRRMMMMRRSRLAYLQWILFTV